MADEVNIDELDTTDLSDILTELKGAPTTVKNAAKGRAELTKLLGEKGMSLSTDDEGNFVLNPKKKGKVAAKAKAPEPEEEEGEEETEEETEEEAEEEDEEETEEEAPPPKKGKAKPAPAPAKPAAKGKAKPAPEPEEEEAEEEEAEEEEVAPPKKGKGTAKPAPAKDGAKRAPPPREPSYGNEAKFTIAEPGRTFKDGSIREALWGIMKKCKTVGGFFERAEKHEREDVRKTARGFLNVAVKDGWIKMA